MNEKRYNEAVAMYNKIMDESPDTKVAADAHYQIALIHAIHDNSQRDYSQAIHEFSEFLKIHPADSRAPEAQNWISVLSFIQEIKKENGILRKDNEQLHKSIEELKKLDIRHEERRRK